MKYILLLILGFFFFYSCNNKTKQKKEQVNVIITKSLIGNELPTVAEKSKELGVEFKFAIVDSINFKFQKVVGKIFIEKIIDWNDPGDFHRVRLIINKKEYSYFNMSGWVKVSDYETQYVELENLVNSKYLQVCNIKDDFPVIILFGYVYASKAGLLSIIELNDSPNLLFNENYFVYSINNEEYAVQVTRLSKEDNEEGFRIENYYLNNIGLVLKE